MKITLIIGLPGSGKTWLANELAEPTTAIIDDITSLDQLPDDAEELIITDVNFCDSTILNQATAILRERYGSISIERVYFENDAALARQNVERRNDGRNVEGTIRRFESIYQPPVNAWRIWRE